MNFLKKSYLFIILYQKCVDKMQFVLYLINGHYHFTQIHSLSSSEIWNFLKQLRLSKQLSSYFSIRNRMFFPLSDLPNVNHMVSQIAMATEQLLNGCGVVIIIIMNFKFTSHTSHVHKNEVRGQSTIESIFWTEFPNFMSKNLINCTRKIAIFPAKKETHMLKSKQTFNQNWCLYVYA